MLKHLIGAIDQSTTSTKFQVFDTTGKLIVKVMKEHRQITPHAGWLEHDPLEILTNLREVILETSHSLKTKDYNCSDLATIGLTNQRETTVAWQKSTGQPFMNAIVWNDMRTISICRDIISRNNGNKNAFKQINGLPINTYFSAFKIQWMIKNCKPLMEALHNNPSDVLFGTMDSWVLWNLTGGNHLTDVSNASRTFLMNLRTLQWEHELLKFFDIPQASLPKILPSGGHFGFIKDGPFAGISINSVLGDQMAAAIGHGIFKEGQSKNTYGTGLFLLANIGEELRVVEEGLLTSVLYQKDESSKPVYAFEGAVECGGSTINWARDQLCNHSAKQQELFHNYDDLSQSVASVDDSDGVYFVPAFSGLYSPYWNEEATGTLIGLSLHSRKAHILRAMFESICLRTKDVIVTMEEATKIKIDFLNIDGGLTQSSVLMKMQADILQKRLRKPKVTDATCLGTAMFAALKNGIIKSEAEIISAIDNEDEINFDPGKAEWAEKKYKGWQKAVQRSLDWNS